MDRRKFLCAALASSLGGQESPDFVLSPTYAESADLDAFTADASQEISIRLGRFPRRGSATLWMTVCLGDKVYSAALEDLKLGSFQGRTPVEAEKVSFTVAGDGEARLLRTSNSALHASARVSAGAHESAEPPPGSGPIHIRIEADFESGHRPVQVRPGRMEVMGHASAAIHVAGRTTKLRGLGKWHEQVGDRPRFAPAFTYLNIIGDRIGLLAGSRRTGAYGYAWMGEQIAMVKSAAFDPIGPRRKFRVELEGGKVIEGEAITHRIVSVPIEGRQRPGATVLVSSSLGRMTGHLNDWDPKD